MNLSEVREAIGNNAIVNDLEDGDVAMAFVGTDVKDGNMNVKAYIDGNSERLAVIMFYCMTSNEDFCKIVAKALELYELFNNKQTIEKEENQ